MMRMKKRTMRMETQMKAFGGKPTLQTESSEETSLVHSGLTVLLEMT
jgi:hypothetical protein